VNSALLSWHLIAGVLADAVDEMCGRIGDGLPPSPEANAVTAEYSQVDRERDVAGLHHQLFKGLDHGVLVLRVRKLPVRDAHQLRGSPAENLPVAVAHGYDVAVKVDDPENRLRGIPRWQELIHLRRHLRSGRKL
jgi:hypothetical protein